MFVKKVKQRLEVPPRPSILKVGRSSLRFPVVQTRTLEGHASESDRPPDSDYAVCQTILPLLRLQHSWWHRGGR